MPGAYSGGAITLFLGVRKKRMLILTDGMPSDVDVRDERLLIEDACQAVKELDQQGIVPTASVSTIFAPEHDGNEPAGSIARP